jgi:hypothetical protein
MRQAIHLRTGKILRFWAINRWNRRLFGATSKNFCCDIKHVARAKITFLFLQKTGDFRAITGGFRAGTGDIPT